MTMNNKEQLEDNAVPEQAPLKQKEGKVSRWITLLSVAVLLLSLRAWNPKAFFTLPANYYIRAWYLPTEILDHYIENILSDVSFVVPVYFESTLLFPDLGEAVDIQVDSRMHNEFFSLLNYTLQLIPGTNSEYQNGAYPKDDVFVNCLLSKDNAIHVDGAESYAELYFNLEGVDANDVPFFMTQLLVDHCFRDEVQKYAPDNFYKLDSTTTGQKQDSGLQDEGKFHLVHADFMSSNILAALLRSGSHKIKVRAEIHVVGATVFSIDMEKAIEEYMQPLFEMLSDFFDLDIVVHNLGMEDSTPHERLNQTGDLLFPSELVNLPVIWDLYQRTKLESAQTDTICVNMLFYPFFQGGELIKEISIDASPIYSDHENTYLTVEEWGSIYFSHILYDSSKSVSKQHLKDCVWSFNENLLDALGVPNGNMAPAVRTKIFKRYMVMQYFTYYSSLLNELRNIISWNTISEAANFSPAKTRQFAEAFAKSLQERKRALYLARSGDLSASIAACRMMVDILQETLHS